MFGWYGFWGPVIPPEVNGVWMVCFWGPVIPPKTWCSRKPRDRKFQFFACLFRFQLSIPPRIFSTSTAAANCFTKKKPMELAFLLRKPFKEPEHSRKPLIWWLQKNDSKQRKKMQLLGVEVCQVGRSGLTC